MSVVHNEWNKTGFIGCERKCSSVNFNMFFFRVFIRCHAFVVFPKIAKTNNFLIISLDRRMFRRNSYKSFSTFVFVDTFHNLAQKKGFRMAILTFYRVVSNDSNVLCIVKSFESIIWYHFFVYANVTLNAFIIIKCAFIRRQVQWAAIEWFSNGENCKQLQIQWENWYFHATPSTND